MSKLWRSVLYWFLLSPLIVFILFPFAVMFATAIKPQEEVLQPTWWPAAPRWRNFLEMWHAADFGPALVNSLFTATTSTGLALLVSIPAAYALSRGRFVGRSFIAKLLLMSQMLSPVVLVLGLFRLAASLGLVDDINALVLVYAAFNVAFAVWMLRAYFDTIPIDIEEAAWLEGASRSKALWIVFLPLAVPAIAVTSTFTFISAWNEFVIALTLLRRQSTYTLPIQIFSLVAGRYTVEWNYVMAAALVATVPVALVFTWLQRYLVRGLSLGAGK